MSKNLKKLHFPFEIGRWNALNFPGETRMLETATLKCSDVRRLLPDYLNGVVDGTTSQLMRWHFYQCGDCRTIVHSAVDTFRENFREDSIRVSSKKRRAA